jgi:hypothetical protein
MKKNNKGLNRKIEWEKKFDKKNKIKCWKIKTN